MDFLSINTENQGWLELFPKLDIDFDIKSWIPKPFGTLAVVIFLINSILAIVFLYFVNLQVLGLLVFVWFPYFMLICQLLYSIDGKVAGKGQNIEIKFKNALFFYMWSRVFRHETEDFQYLTSVNVAWHFHESFKVNKKVKSKRCQ